MEERPREGETYDFRRYDRLWQRVAPGLEPYPSAGGETGAAAAGGAAEPPAPAAAAPAAPASAVPADRLPGAAEDPCCMGSTAGEMLAVLTGVHPAILFRTILPLFEIPLAYLIAYWLLERFFANSRTKALLGLIYYVCFVVAAAEHMGQNSNEWWLVVDVWTGKALSFAIVTPLILWLLIRIEEDPPGERPRLWRVLLLVCWGGFFISATLFYVIPMELLIWGGGRLLRVRQGEDIPRYLLCVAPAAACALLSFLL